MKHRVNFFVITLAMIFFSIGADAFIIYQLENYETRFLEIYGSEQDGYVNVVLQQINRLGENATEEDITEIISSLDATASRYWTLSKEDSILFVKSVTETNRYKGFTDGTYYATETASEFMESLGVNQVGHKVIYLNEDRFVASGMIFHWKGEQYRICLLTYDRAILEDNVLLECKNSIIIILSMVLALLVVLSMVMSRIISRQRRSLQAGEERVIWQNQQIQRLDEQLKRENAFSASKHVFQGSALNEFLDALDERNVRPLHFAVFEAGSKEVRDEFFEHMQVVLDNRVLRFSMDRRLVLLVFAKYERRVSDRMIESLEGWNIRLLANLYCKDNMESYRAQFQKLWEEVTAP